MSLSRLFASVASVIALAGLSGCGQKEELSIQLKLDALPEVSSDRKLLTVPALEELRAKCISADPAKSKEDAEMLKAGCARNKELFLRMNPDATATDYFRAPIQLETRKDILRM